MEVAAMDKDLFDRLYKYAQVYLVDHEIELPSGLEEIIKVCTSAKSILQNGATYHSAQYIHAIEEVVAALYTPEFSDWQSTVQRLRAADYGGVFECDLLSDPYSLFLVSEKDEKPWRITIATGSWGEDYLTYEEALNRFLELVDGTTSSPA
jgi:hypothetical protein